MPPVPMTAMRIEASRESRYSPMETYSRLAAPNNPGGEIMPAQPTSSAREAIRGTVPKLAEISDTIIYGEIWERPGLSKRDRSLIVVATLIALGREKQLEGHLARALANGVTRDEIGELITHLAFYAGWPAAMTAALIAKEVFAKS
jgi:4-carboxymuconolactone decarboxylase